MTLYWGRHKFKSFFDIFHLPQTQPENSSNISSIHGAAPFWRQSAVVRASHAQNEMLRQRGILAVFRLGMRLEIR